VVGEKLVDLANKCLRGSEVMVVEPTSQQNGYFCCGTPIGGMPRLGSDAPHYN